ncbi:MAG: 2-hydroxyacyl-CoA dehydratase [Deltaproteobacteria bacterium]|nr:2-hydroxyacyl-CoA dehydratase [Deltaproteobacteria bacterium]
MSEYYDTLLELCDFTPEEIDGQRPRIEMAIEKIGLDRHDFSRAEERVSSQHDIALRGVRRLLRAWLLELLDLVLSREEGKKVVYYGYPSIQGPGMTIKAASTIDLYVGCPDVVLCHTLGQIFDKLTPILETAEKGGLPPGHGLCSLQQVRSGALALGIVPVPDLVTGSSYFCDMGSKADELLHEIYGHPAIYVDGSMDSDWGAYPQLPSARIKYLGAQIDKLFATVKDLLGVEVTPQSSEKAMLISRRFFSGLGRLTKLMAADPMPVSGVESGLALNLAAASTGISMTEGAEAIELLCGEVAARVDTSEGIMEKGAPRILSFIQPFSDPSITHMMESAGLALSSSIVTVPPPKRDPSIQINTLGEERAEAALRDLYHSGYGLVKRFEDAARRMEVDGVLWGYLFNCRPLAQYSHLVKQWVEEKTGIPTLSLEMDIYDSRNYGPEALKTRVEAFAEMLRARKAA